MTSEQRRMLAHAIMVAQNASSDLGRNAGDGPKARPTVAQLNRTMERLESIQLILKEAMR